MAERGRSSARDEKGEGDKAPLDWGICDRLAGDTTVAATMFRARYLSKTACKKGRKTFVNNNMSEATKSMHLADMCEMCSPGVRRCVGHREITQREAETPSRYGIRDAMPSVVFREERSSLFHSPKIHEIFKGLLSFSFF